MRTLLKALAFLLCMVGVAIAARKLNEEMIGVQQIFWETAGGLPIAVSTAAPLPIQGTITTSQTNIGSNLKLGGEPFQVTCATTATQFPSNASAKMVCVTNAELAGGTIEYLGKAAVTTSTGGIYHPGSSGCVDLDSNTNELYCRVASGTATMSGEWYVTR